jgi:hypothetical protein
MHKKLGPIELDIEQLRRNLLRQAAPRRVCHFEHGIAEKVKDEVAARHEIPAAITSPDMWQRETRIHRLLGFELFRVWLPGAEFQVAGSLGISWGEEHTGPIQSWNDVERYDWPRPEDIDFSQLDYHERNLPEE